MRTRRRYSHGREQTAWAGMRLWIWWLRSSSTTSMLLWRVMVWCRAQEWPRGSVSGRRTRKTSGFACCVGLGRTISARVGNILAQLTHRSQIQDHALCTMCAMSLHLRPRPWRAGSACGVSLGTPELIWELSLYFLMVIEWLLRHYSDITIGFNDIVTFGEKRSICALSAVHLTFKYRGCTLN
jgi:hypothetical protein